MKIKNKVHRSDNPEVLKILAEEIEFIGREYELNLKEGTLTVFALPQKRKAKKKHEKTERNKRFESAARNNKE